MTLWLSSFDSSMTLLTRIKSLKIYSFTSNYRVLADEMRRYSLLLSIKCPYSFSSWKNFWFLPSFSIDSLFTSFS